MTLAVSRRLGRRGSSRRQAWQTRSELGAATRLRSWVRPTDEDMRSIGKLNNLRRLILAGSAVTDAGAVHLKNLTRLAELDLSQTKIGDAACNTWPDCSALRS